MRAHGAVAVVASLLLTSACGGHGTGSEAANRGHRPYAGLEKRAIPALSEKEVRDLRAGNGMGYALVAELNEYPGPLHVVELSDELELSAEQLETTHGIRRAMLSEARPLGRQLVHLEAELGRAFRSRTIDVERLESLTQRIGRTEARLRAVHLAAHVELRPILTEDQVALYDRLRGYRGGGHENHETEMHER